MLWPSMAPNRARRSSGPSNGRNTSGAIRHPVVPLEARERLEAATGARPQHLDRLEQRHDAAELDGASDVGLTGSLVVAEFAVRHCRRIIADLRNLKVTYEQPFSLGIFCRNPWSIAA